MKLKPVLYLAAAISLLFAACNNDDALLPEESGSGNIVFSVTDFEDADAASSRVDVTIVTGGANFTWSTGDTLGVYPLHGDQTEFPIGAGAGTEKASFDGANWALRQGAQYAAYYPFKGAQYYRSYDNIKVDYTGQCQNGNNSTAHIGKYDFLYAPFTAIDSASTGTHFKLGHIGCLVMFQLTMPDPDTYTKLVVTTGESSFAMTGHYALGSGESTLVAEKSNKSFTLDLQNVTTTAHDQTITLFAMMPPTVTSATNEWLITVKGEHSTFAKKVVRKSTLAGSCYIVSATMGYYSLAKYKDVKYTNTPIYGFAMRYVSGSRSNCFAIFSKTYGQHDNAFEFCPAFGPDHEKGCRLNLSAWTKLTNYYTLTDYVDRDGDAVSEACAFLITDLIEKTGLDLPYPVYFEDRQGAFMDDGLYCYILE